MTISREALLRQIDLSRQEIQKLSKLYPGAFDKNGKPIVASASLPTTRRPK